MAMKIHQELTEAERRNRRRLGSALALLLLSSKSPAALLLSAPEATKTLAKTIRGLHAAPRRLADAFQPSDGDPEPVETSDPLLRAATAMGLVSSVIGTTQRLTREGTTFQEALSQAVDAAGPRLDRIAATETMTAFNGQVRANLKNAVGEFRWDSTLDKRTCDRCASLNGRTWENLSDVPAIPAHVSCRCILTFVPA